MLPEERLMIGRVINRLVRLPEAAQDPDAVIELESFLKARPDGAYLLLQRAVLLEEALRRATEEIARLRGETGSPPSAERSFASPANTSVPPAFAGPGGNAGAMVPATAYPPMAPTAPSGGGFLRNAAAIGAGVLGGNLLFQGLESLLHPSAGGGFFGGAGNSPSEMVENNYFGSSDPQRGYDPAGAAGFDGDRGEVSDLSAPLDNFDTGSYDDSSSDDVI